MHSVAAEKQPHTCFYTVLAICGGRTQIWPLIPCQIRCCLRGRWLPVLLGHCLQSFLSEACKVLHLLFSIVNSMIALMQPAMSLKEVDASPLLSNAHCWILLQNSIY